MRAVRPEVRAAANSASCLGVCVARGQPSAPPTPPVSTAGDGPGHAASNVWGGRGIARGFYAARSRFCCVCRVCTRRAPSPPSPLSPPLTHPTTSKTPQRARPGILGRRPRARVCPPRQGRRGRRPGRRWERRRAAAAAAGVRHLQGRRRRAAVLRRPGPDVPWVSEGGGEADEGGGGVSGGGPAGRPVCGARARKKLVALAPRRPLFLQKHSRPLSFSHTAATAPCTARTRPPKPTAACYCRLSTSALTPWARVRRRLLRRLRRRRPRRQRRTRVKARRAARAAHQNPRPRPHSRPLRPPRPPTTTTRRPS